MGLSWVDRTFPTITGELINDQANPTADTETTISPRSQVHSTMTGISIRNISHLKASVTATAPTGVGVC